MKVVILPKKEPFTKTFPQDVNAPSIAPSILLNYESVYLWLMNNFIQLTRIQDRGKNYGLFLSIFS